MISLKIVMLHDCAYVGATLSEWLQKMNVEVELLPMRGLLRTMIKLRRIDCDLVHVHYARAPSWVAMFSGKRYIIHCHGDDIRHGYNYLTKVSLSKASLVLFATPDLSQYIHGSVYLPTPIDSKFFKPIRKINTILKALYFKRETAHPKTRQNESKHIRVIENACQSSEIKLDILPKGSVKYSEMPNLLSRYDLFFDGWMLPAYSKTAFEAMSTAIPVIGYNDNMDDLNNILLDLKSNPVSNINRGNKVVESHLAEKVSEKMLQLYLEILR